MKIKNIDLIVDRIFEKIDLLNSENPVIRDGKLFNPLDINFKQKGFVDIMTTIVHKEINGTNIRQKKIDYISNIVMERIESKDRLKKLEKITKKLG